MRFKSVLVLCILFNEAGQFVGIMNWGGGFYSSDGVVIEETKFEGKGCYHHLDILDWDSFVLGQIILNDEVVGRRSKTFCCLLGNEIKLIIIVANVFAQKGSLLRTLDFG
jgi:hypothetical protein